MRPLPPGSAANAAHIATEIKGMAAPVTVIAPQTPNEDGKARTHTQPALAFLSAYARIAPTSYASHPSWRLDHSKRAAYQYGDTTQGTVEK
jgi:hypothetical protein